MGLSGLNGLEVALSGLKWLRSGLMSVKSGLKRLKSGFTLEEHRKNEQKMVKIATFFSEKLEEPIPR